MYCGQSGIFLYLYLCIIYLRPTPPAPHSLFYHPSVSFVSYHLYLVWWFCCVSVVDGYSNPNVIVLEVRKHI
ncbi:hypothetical protein EI94DRAFT_67873 [Lactarius quietus]|nr:hypothetical protein EI94DRAFT_67873 [Lactarius quietus]